MHMWIQVHIALSNSSAANLSALHTVSGISLVIEILLLQFHCFRNIKSQWYGSCV
jgi:hypothetical protein